MYRRIAVENAEGENDTAVAEYEEIAHDPLKNEPGGFMGRVGFCLSSNGEDLNLESQSRFRDMDGEVYFVKEDHDKEWLSRL